jgi:hypothetical protein
MDPTALSDPATTVIPLDDSNQMLLPSQTKNEKGKCDDNFQENEKQHVNAKDVSI